MPPFSSQPQPLQEPKPSNIALKNYYEYLKDLRQNMGMESITEDDMAMLDTILADAVRDKKYDLEGLSRLFSLIEQLAASESFADAKVKDMVLRQIQLYRIELAIK